MHRAATWIAVTQSVPSFAHRGALARAVAVAEAGIVRSVKVRARRSRLAEPVVSFSFDDFPKSALTEGGRILRDGGWAGTFYASGSHCGQEIDGIRYFDREDLVRAEQDGHEIGCHTFSHLRLSRVSSEAICQDLKRNAGFVREVLPHCVLSSFAYPFGDVGLRTKFLLARQFPVCRGIEEGLNAGRIDFSQLRSLGVGRSFDEIRIENWLDRAAAAAAWLIFFFHDISDSPSPFGCSREVFARIVAAVARRRIKVLPVRDAARLSSGEATTV